jgi:hypothetical protein
MLQEEVLGLAGRYLKKLRRVGNDNISAICPFHVKSNGAEEKSPSFSMSLSKGVWHCFTCQMSGTFGMFLRDVGVSRVTITNQFGEILEALRKNHGPLFDPMRPKVVEADPLPESMLGLFEKCPVHMVDAEAALELDPDDPVVFDEDLLQQYDVGFDDVHQRITFPIRDLAGGLIGISGRTINGAIPRYKVYDQRAGEEGHDHLERAPGVPLGVLRQLGPVRPGRGGLPWLPLGHPVGRQEHHGPARK